MLRRKERHRFWGVDSYSHEEGRHLRIGNRLFQEDPDERVEPSAQVVVAQTPGRGNWYSERSQTVRPPCSATQTVGAARRWNFVPRATWCPTLDIPPWEGRGR